jgi:hypothetical protein
MLSLVAFAVLPLAALVACESRGKSDADRARDEAAASASAKIAAQTSVVDAAPQEDPLAQDVRETFEKKWSCPAERVDLVLRTGVDFMQYHPFRSKKPTDEVKNDPARLAKWNDDQAADLAQHRRFLVERRLFEVRGCGHVEFQDCRPHHSKGAVYPNVADCGEVTAPAASSSASAR